MAKKTLAEQKSTATAGELMRDGPFHKGLCQDVTRVNYVRAAQSDHYKTLMCFLHVFLNSYLPRLLNNC